MFSGGGQKLLGVAHFRHLLQDFSLILNEDACCAKDYNEYLIISVLTFTDKGKNSCASLLEKTEWFVNINKWELTSTKTGDKKYKSLHECYKTVIIPFK